MNALAAWVREILLVVLLGWVLEVFLPAEGFRRYVRLVVGLFVIVGVMGPIFSFLRGQMLPAGFGAGPEPLLVTSAQPAEEAAWARAYGAELDHTAAAMALTVPGVLAAEGQVLLQPTGDGRETLSSVTVRIRTGGGGAPPPALAARVTTAVAAGLAVPPSLVHVEPMP